MPPAREAPWLATTSRSERVEASMRRPAAFRPCRISVAASTPSSRASAAASCRAASARLALIVACAEAPTPRVSAAHTNNRAVAGPLKLIACLAASAALGLPSTAQRMLPKGGAPSCAESGWVEEMWPPNPLIPSRYEAGFQRSSGPLPVRVRENYGSVVRPWSPQPNTDARPPWWAMTSRATSTGAERGTCVLCGFVRSFAGADGGCSARRPGVASARSPKARNR